MPRPLRILSALLSLALIGLWSGTSRADFVLFEDFDALTLGPIDEQDGWNARSDTSAVTLDPEPGSNQVLAVTTDSTSLYKNLLLSNDTVRMVFLRFRFAEQQNYSFGLSDSAYPDQFGNFEVEINMSNASTELRINDGGTYDVIATPQTNTWYNVWLLVNNSTDCTRIYMHARPGEPANENDLIVVGEQDTFDFRDGATGDLRSFFIKTGGGSGPAGPLYIDAIYMENADALNLSNPTTLPQCPGDIDGDGLTNLNDLATLLGAYDSALGDPDYVPAADLDDNGLIDLSDLAYLLADYGCGA